MTDTLDAILAQLEATLSVEPEHATFLDPVWYHSDELYDREVDRIFHRQWLCVARTDQLPKPGDFIATTVVDEPVVIVRGHDGDISTYSNVCRHRSYPVAEGSGNTRRFTCRYHMWSYGLDGSLLNAPGMAESATDLSTCALPPVRTEVWNGFVFINLDDGAEPLTPQIASLSRRVERYELDTWTTVAVDDRTWHGNWKLTIENALDSYHHSGLHANSLQASMPGLGTRFIGDHTTWAHHATPFSPTFAREVEDQVTGLLTQLDDADRATMNVFYVYPTFVLPLLPSSMNWLSIIPADRFQTRVSTGIAFPPEALRSFDIDAETPSSLTHEALVQINDEDRQATERLQATTRSHHAARGPMSSREIGVLHYYRYLAQRLLHPSDSSMRDVRPV